MIHQLLYVSGAVEGVGMAEIDAILEVSRRNNAALGITGMLLFTDATFIQMLEGATATVRAMERRLRADPRHRNLMILSERRVTERAFADWNMGFRRLEPGSADDGAVFEISRGALERRISPDQAALRGVMLSFAGERRRDA